MRWHHGALLLASLLVASAPGMAQLNLPRLPGPQLPSPGTLVRDVSAAAQQARSSVRIRADALLGRYPLALERDARGAPIMRAVILALSPDPQALQRALALGYGIQSDTRLDPLDARAVTLLVPRGVSTRRALQQLRGLDPGGNYDFDHLFAESGAAPHAAVSIETPVAAPAAADAPRIGLIDGGVDADHPVFAQARPELLGCGGRVIPGAHGTAVASLLTGAAAPLFTGAAPAAPLVAVDVYCGTDQPGGRTRDIVLALAQLAAKQVAVINISMVGPHNVVLQAVVGRVQQQGILIVAAAGNDGPRAPALYPAAYPGVIAVSAVDARNKVLLEAGGGSHVQFAAPGADMLAASPGGGYVSVRGTSYAAPLVAGLVQKMLAAQDGPGRQQVVLQLAASAEDHGRKGRDPRYGYGIVAQDLRVPASVHAARPLQH